MLPHRPNAISTQGVLSEAMRLIQSAPPTWQSALFSNLSIFIVGSPILVSGLSLSGIFAAFLLGTLTWRAFGPSGFLLVASYFIIGTAATKVKMAQKEAQGVAEKRKGRRGPGSVIGSSAAGCVCAFLSIFRVGDEAFLALWRLGFVASFCTKLSDTVSSEIGKAYGKTTYLVTTFKVVPRGTEGAVSAEGTIAGLLASILLASIGCLMGEHEKMFSVHQQRTLGLMMGCQIGAASSSSKLSILCLNRIQGDFTRLFIDLSHMLFLQIIY
ncbi:protein VTE6 [Populus alba x Populus x berolinensis]|nr:protein VTE6 [Populus alba x Populus x berolinensis]